MEQTKEAVYLINDDKYLHLRENGADVSKVKAGTILRVYVDGNGQGTAVTSWWNMIVRHLMQL